MNTETRSRELAPPPPGSIFVEGLTPLEVPRMALSAPRLLAARRGARKKILVVPGFGAGDASTLLLRGYLAYLGHDVSGWGLGANQGDVIASVARIGERVRETFARSGEPVVLLGWSLGGIICREVARENPDAVQLVVTMGSPVKGGPKYTRVAEVYARMGNDIDEIVALMQAREVTPIRVPLVALYSKLDGIVAWRACFDDYSPDVEHIQVQTTHLGFGVSAEVFALIAQKLAALSH